MCAFSRHHLFDGLQLRLKKPPGVTGKYKDINVFILWKTITRSTLWFCTKLLYVCVYQMIADKIKRPTQTTFSEIQTQIKHI